MLPVRLGGAVATSSGGIAGLGIVGLAVVMVALLVGQAGHGAPAAQSPAGGTALPSGVPATVLTANVQLPGPVYDLTYDSTRNVLWFAYLSPPHAALYEYDIPSGALADWPLPPTDYNGFLGRIAVAPDGSIWTIENYQVSRFEPRTAALASKTLVQADPDATATALDPASSSPGTWISGITFDRSGNAVLGRHNVAALITMDASLDVVSRLPFNVQPPGPGDVADVGGVIFGAPYAGNGATGIMSVGGQIGASVRGSIRLAPASAGVVSIGAEGVQLLLPSGSPVKLMDADGSLGNRIALNGNDVFVYLDGVGTLQRIRIDSGTITGPIALPETTMDVQNPAGGTTMAYRQQTLSAIAADATSTLWCVDLTTGVLGTVRF